MRYLFTAARSVTRSRAGSAVLGVTCVALGSVVLGIAWFFWPDLDAIIPGLIGAFAVHTGLELLEPPRGRR